MTNEETIHKKHLEFVRKEVYEFLHRLYQTIMNDIFEVKVR